MITLRTLGLAWRDQTLSATDARFAPWMYGPLLWLACSGGLMCVGEPPRALLAVAFWMKITLVAFGVAAHATLRRRPDKALAAATLVVWVGVIVLGRLIAYDYVWGSWSDWLKG